MSPPPWEKYQRGIDPQPDEPKPWERYAKLPSGKTPAGAPSDILRLVPSAIQGVSDSAADIFGMPGDLINFAGRTAGVLPPDRRSPIGSDAVRHGFDQVATVPGRVMDAVSQGSVAPLTDPRTARVDPHGAVQMAAYGLGHGGGTAAAMLTGAGAVQPMLRAGGVPARAVGALTQNPLLQIGAGAGSGAIGGAADNPWIGLASSVALPALYATGRNAMVGGMGPFTEQGQNRLLAHLALKSSGETDPAILAARIRASTREFVPGSPRTTAEVTNSAGVAGMERGMRNDPLVVQAFADRDAARLAARDAQLAGLPPGQPPAVAGAEIRGRFEAKYGDAQDATRKAYGAVDKTGQTVDVTGAYTRAAQHVNARFGPGSGGPPGELTDMLADLRASNVPLGTVENIRSRAMALAQRSSVPGPTMDARIASSAREVAAAADEAIANAASSGTTMDPAQRAALLQARQARSAQGEFERSPVGKTLRNEYGEYKVPDAIVPDKVFHRGPTAETDGVQFRRLVGNDPQALQAVQSDAIMSFRTAAYNQRGEFVAENARKWLKAHEGSLKAFPETLAEIRKTISPVLADTDSFRFARDAGRSIGSNTVQNQMLELAINNATSGLPVGSLPGVAPFMRVASKMAGSGMEGMRDRFGRLLLNPDEMAGALDTLAARPARMPVMSPRILAPAVGETINNRR